MNKFSISCLLLLCSLAYSCSIEYDGTTKIIFEGRVTNQNGQPLANVPIAIEISDGHDSDISGRDITDANGNYHAVSPGAREKVTYTVRVNYINHNQPADNTYSTSSYYNIIPDLLDDYLVNTGTTQLYTGQDSVSLNIQHPQSPGLLKLNILGVVSDNYVDYNFTLPPQEDDDVIGEYYFDGNYTVAPNQDVLIRYMLTDGTVMEETVHIGTQDLTYTLTY